MAYNYNWQVFFVDQSNKKYRAAIYRDGDAVGDIQTLNGALQTFIEDIDTDEDIYTPIRLKSGYLRVVAESDISDLFAKTYNDRRVILYQNNSSVNYFVGYLQPTSNDLPWTGYPKEVELPVVSAIGILREIDVDKADGMGLVSLGDLFMECLDKTYNYYAITFPLEWAKGTGGRKDFAVWDVKVQRSSFFSASESDPDSPDYRQYETISYYDVLERIMKFWGWTLYEFGNEIVITSHTAEKYARVLRNNFSKETPTYSTYNRSAIALPSIAGSDHSESTIEGAKSVTVRCNAREGTNTLFEVNANDANIKLRESFDVEIGNSRQGKYTMAGYDTKIGANCEVQFHAYPLRYLNFDERAETCTYTIGDAEDVDMADFVKVQLLSDAYTYEDVRSMGGEVNTYFGCKLCKIDTFLSSNTPKNLTLTDKIVAGCGFLTMDWEEAGTTGIAPSEEDLKAHPIVTVRGRQPVSMSEGVICLEILEDSFTYAFSGVSFNVRLKVGDKYYNGSSWQDSEAWFTYSGDSKTTYKMYPEYNDAVGQIMKATTPLTGTLELDIALKPWENWTNYAGIDTIDARCLAMLPDLFGSQSRVSCNSYYGYIQSLGEHKIYELDMLTMSNNVICDNALWWGNEWLTTQLEYKGEAKRPEVVLVEKMKAWMSKTRKMIKVTTAFGSKINPRYLLEYDGDHYVYVGSDVDYYNKRQTITMIENG